MPSESKLKAVLDTNIFVASFRSSRGASSEIVRLWIEEDAFQLIISDPILAEVLEILVEKNAPEIELQNLVEALKEHANITDNTYVVYAITKDPDDNIFLAAALEGRADYIVSLDRHVLSLKHYHRIQIVRPKDFLQVLRAQK